MKPWGFWWLSESRNVELGRDSPSKILHEVKADAQAAEIRHLSKPFWATLLIGAVSPLALVVLLARSLDSNAIATSELLRQADVALYSAKRQGKGQLAIYSSRLLDPGKAALNP